MFVDRYEMTSIKKTRRNNVSLVYLKTKRHQRKNRFKSDNFLNSLNQRMWRRFNDVPNMVSAYIMSKVRINFPFSICIKIEFLKKSN